MVNTESIKDKYLFYFFLVILTLTTFPLAQGWGGTGDFIPRAFMILVVIVLRPKLLFQKDFILLLLFFFYTYIVSPKTGLVALAANIMEFMIPLIVAHFIIDSRNEGAAKIMALYVIVITTLNMLLTIVADFSSPNIVRQMVAFTYQGDEASALIFRRVGVCNYSFALIAMCMTPVYIYLASWFKKKYIYIALAILSFYFVYITGVTTCLILCVFMTLLAVFMRKQNNVKVVVPTALLMLVFLIVFGFALVDLAEPLLKDTTFESHFDGLKGFFGKGTASSEAYEFDERVVLYKYSLDTFISHPLFGSASGKNGGHNYFLDRLASFGVFGMFFFFSMIYIRFKKALFYIPHNARTTFLICLIGFFALGFLKNMSGIDYWTYMFVYIPCVLKYQEKKDKRTSII